MEHLKFSNLVKDIQVDDAKRISIMSKVAPADRCYVIMFSARSGSSWLTSVLSATKRLGFPEEFLNPNFVAAAAKSLEAKTADDLLHMLKRQKKSPNGIFGVEVRDVDIRLLGADAFARAFADDAIFFHLWRENIVAQAVSLYRAVASKRYHSNVTARAEAPPPYDAEQILSWLQHVAATENGNVRVMRQFGVAARHLHYETVTADRLGTVRMFAHVLAVPFKPDDFQESSERELKKIGDAWNLDMEERVRRDRPEAIAGFEDSRLVKHGVPGEALHAMPEEPALQTAWRSGRSCGTLGRSPLLNPNEPGGAEHAAWLTGWRNGWDDQPIKTASDDAPPAAPSVPLSSMSPPPPPPPAPALTSAQPPAPQAADPDPSDPGALDPGTQIQDVSLDPSTVCKIGPGRFKPNSSLLVTGKHNAISIGAGASGAFRMRIDGDSCRLHIEEFVKTRGMLIIFMGHGSSHLKIGAGTTFTANARLLMDEASSLHLGADCMIAGNVDMMTSDSHPIYDLAGPRINPAESILVGDHVWICEGARIMKGARIGVGSVVALNAIVTSGIYPANSLLAGSPARVVRQNIRWERKFA